MQASRPCVQAALLCNDACSDMQRITASTSSYTIIRESTSAASFLDLHCSLMRRHHNEILSRQTEGLDHSESGDSCSSLLRTTRMTDAQRLWPWPEASLLSIASSLLSITCSHMQIVPYSSQYLVSRAHITDLAHSHVRNPSVHKYHNGIGSIRSSSTPLQDDHILQKAASSQQQAGPDPQQGERLPQWLASARFSSQ